jgi:nitrite reductase/ring-hydroxylating ferredoxin subunit
MNGVVKYWMRLPSMAPSPDPDGAGSSHITEPPWQVLTGLHPEQAKYPARATIGGEGIVVFRTNSGFRGMQRSCPHMRATMMSAELVANDTMVRCPLHIFTFKLSDGRGVNCPGHRLKIYDIKNEAGVFYGRPAN